MAVNIPDNVPAIGLKARSCIISKPANDITIDRYLVTVKNANEFAQFQCPCKGTHFMGYTLHQAPVTHRKIGIVVNKINIFTVKFCSK